jgi:LacI family transcriptional regulator
VKSATIQEVAERAGVSTTTVSRVINNEETVRAKTRDKVQEAIRELNYRPNLNARGLAGDRSFLVGLFIENPGSYANDIQIGMAGRCLEEGLHLMVEPLQGSDPEIGAKVSRILRELRLEAAVLLPPHCDNPDVIARLDEERVPFIQVAPTHRYRNTPVIRVDDYAASRLMTKHLIELGHRRIGFMQGRPGHRATTDRYAGFHDEMAAGGLSVDPELVVPGYFTFDGGITAAQTMLDNKRPPTAIFTCGDDMAMAALSVAHERGLRLPDDLSVTGFDDSPVARMAWPRLTTIRQPVREIGAAAIDLIIDRAPHRNGWPETSEEMVLDFKLVIRKSTTPPV